LLISCQRIYFFQRNDFDQSENFIHYGIKFLLCSRKITYIVERNIARSLNGGEVYICTEEIFTIKHIPTTNSKLATSNPPLCDLLVGPISLTYARAPNSPIFYLPCRNWEQQHGNEIEGEEEVMTDE
jgi:hypothetical protein